jgi:hypothetical protein
VTFNITRIKLPKDSTQWIPILNRTSIDPNSVFFLPYLGQASVIELADFLVSAGVVTPIFSLQLYHRGLLISRSSTISAPIRRNPQLFFVGMTLERSVEVVLSLLSDNGVGNTAALVVSANDAAKQNIILAARNLYGQSAIYNYTVPGAPSPLVQSHVLLRRLTIRYAADTNPNTDYMVPIAQDIVIRDPDFTYLIIGANASIRLFEEVCSASRCEIQDPCSDAFTSFSVQKSRFCSEGDAAKIGFAGRRADSCGAESVCSCALSFFSYQEGSFVQRHVVLSGNLNSGFCVSDSNSSVRFQRHKHARRHVHFCSCHTASGPCTNEQPI